MPMSKGFRCRLMPNIERIAEHFGTPFHLYDEKGITETSTRLLRSFAEIHSLFGFKEFFAVKGLPNPRIMEILREFGFGYDCSSVPELNMARKIGAKPEDIMFSSNNTSEDDFKAALSDGGCILNLDDINLTKKVPGLFPELISYRYNPGEKRTGNKIIGNPVESKYGVADHQIVEAYEMAISRGAERFGIHTMLASNELNFNYMVETVRMLLEVTETIYSELGIRFEFMNMGGGLGIPYKQEDPELPLEIMAKEIFYLMHSFKKIHGWVPSLFMESARYMSGPHGVLVTRCINRKDTYKHFRGVDASMSALMRPAMYWPEGGYHHITINKAEGRKRLVQSVVGSLCENCDQFARDRLMPEIFEGDLVMIHDTGAHGHAMGFNYNAKLRPQELLLRTNGQVEMIRRAETEADYLSTLNFEPKVMYLNH